MLSFREAVRQIKGGSIAPVYLLAGGDAFLEDFLIGEVTGRFLSSGSRKQVFSLDDDQVEKVLAELAAYDLFQEHQVMVVRQVQRLTGNAREELLTYVKAPNPDKCLLLVLDEYQPTKGLHKALSKLVPVVDTRPPFPDQMRSLAEFYARGKGVSLPADAVDLLLDLVGDSAGHVVSELEKILTRLDEGDTVTREMVETQVAPDKAYHLWHLQEAVAGRDTERSLRVTVSLLEYGTQATRIVAAVASLFGQLLFLQTGTAAERVYTGLNKPVTTRLNSMRDRYTLSETSRILRKLRTADVNLKSTSVEARQIMIGLIAAICRGVV